jgi:AmmeMemoRadiSam system protein A
VRANAQAAAFEDPRFAPLSVWEFPELEIEVSVLDPAEPLDVHDWAQACRALRPGVDGVILECRGRRATFLPQVWDELPAPADFLRALCHKAGLPDDTWSDELRLWRYRVRKFKAEHRPEVQ